MYPLTLFSIFQDGNSYAGLVWAVDYDSLRQYQELLCAD